MDKPMKGIDRDGRDAYIPTEWKPIAVETDNGFGPSIRERGV